MYSQCVSERAAAQQRMFEHALLELMKEKLFENISISELCRKTGLSRKVFYRLYEAKADVVYAMIDHAILDAESFVPDASVGPGDVHKFLAYWKSRKELLDVMKANRISALLSQQAVLHIMREEPAITQSFGAGDSPHTQEVMSFYVTGLFALVLNWHDRGFDYSIDELSAVIMELFTTAPVKAPIK